MKATASNSIYRFPLQPSVTITTLPDSRPFSARLHPTQDPARWAGARLARPSPASYGNLAAQYSPATLATLRRFVNCRDIDYRTRHEVRSLSPTRVVALPDELYQAAPQVATPSVPVNPREVRVDAAQASVLQLMQLVISSARAVLPYSGNQLASLHDSRFVSNVCVNLLREMPDHERRNIYKSMDPAARDAPNGERAASLVSLVAAASHRAGNCGELNSFCFHLLASLPEMKPYRLELLHSEELNHQVVVAYVNGKPLVCDAWPQYPMAAPASEVLPAWRQAFFPEGDDWRFQILALKNPNTQTPAFPADDVLAAATRGTGRKAALAELKDAFGNEGAYVRYSMRNLDEAPRLYSVLYSSNPGLHYLAGDGQRFNLRYLYRPATRWFGDHVQ